MSNANKGFASMDKEKVKEIAHKGGEARKEQLGPEGYAKLGHEGGEARKKQLGGSEGYAELGRKGGQTKRENVSSADHRETTKRGAEIYPHQNSQEENDFRGHSEKEGKKDRSHDRQDNLLHKGEEKNIGKDEDMGHHRKVATQR